MRPKTQTCKFAYKLNDQSVVGITITQKLIFVINQSLQRKRSTKKNENTESAYLSLKKLIQPLHERSEQETTLSVERNGACHPGMNYIVIQTRHPLMSNIWQPTTVDFIASEWKRKQTKTTTESPDGDRNTRLTSREQDTKDNRYLLISLQPLNRKLEWDINRSRLQTP